MKKMLKVRAFALLLVVALFVVSCSSEGAEELYSKAMSKYDAKDYKGAVEDFSKAASANPQIASVFYYRGLSKQEIGDLEGAIADFERTLFLDPNLVSAYYNKAVSEAVLERYADAINSCNRLLSIDPQNAQAKALRSMVNQARGDFSSALMDVFSFVGKDGLVILNDINRLYKLKNGAK